MCVFWLANSQVFTGGSTGQVTSINERNDIVRLEELNLGLCLPHSCGMDEAGVQLLRNKALVDSEQCSKDAIRIGDLNVKETTSILISLLTFEMKQT